MSLRSLIRKNQLHPDVIDLITGYGSSIFSTKNEINQIITDISGNFVKKFSDENITGVKNFTSRPTVNNIPLLLSGEATNNEGSSLFDGQRPITANVLGFEGVNPGTTNINDFLDKVFYPFIPASASLDSYPIREFGLTSNMVNFAGSISAGNEIQINSIIYQTGYNNIYTTVSTETFQNIKSSFSFSNSNIVFKTTNFRVILQFPNVGGSPSPLTITDTKNSIYEAPYYYGSSNLTSLNSSQVTSLTKGPILQNPSSVTHDFSPVNQYMYIACPNDNNFNLTPWGTITSVKDINTNFDYTNDLNSPQTLAVTVGGGRVINYKVYRWKNLINGGTFKLQFNF
jgi:hypothetical protein